MGDERFKLLREGEHSDQTGDGMHKKAMASAREGDHLVRRTVTMGYDELLSVDHKDRLSVYAREYVVMQSAGGYHCSCGEEFENAADARAHLLEAGDR